MTRLRFLPGRRRLCRAAFCLLALCGGAQRAAAAEAPEKPANTWPRFRGPLGLGLTAEKNLPKTWGPDANLQWRTPLSGSGSSSPVIWGERILLTVAKDRDGVVGHDRFLVCLDRASGSVLWETLAADNDPGKTHVDNSHASSTPATDGQRIYSFYGAGGLQCHDFAGKRLWIRDDLGEFLSVWGSAASPILHKDLCILVCDQDVELVMEPDRTKPTRSYILAVDKHTGQTRWKTPRFNSRGWSTPVEFVDQNGNTQLIVNGPGGVSAYHPDTGAEIWSCRRDSLFGEPLPVFGHGLIYAFGGRPGAVLAIRPGGAGDVTATQVAWSVDRRLRDVASPALRVGQSALASAAGRADLRLAHRRRRRLSLFSQPRRRHAHHRPAARRLRRAA
jgi:outer membrane protein assembly factor BamB